MTELLVFVAIGMVCGIIAGFLLGYMHTIGKVDEALDRKLKDRQDSDWFFELFPTKGRHVA
jgi:hypothetical protein